VLSSQADRAPDDLLLRFFRAARGVGCRISPPEGMDAMSAVATVGYADKAALRDALLLTLAKTLEEKAALAEVFEMFFKSPEPKNLEEASRTRRRIRTTSPATIRARARTPTPASTASWRAC
jgi:uncharacterized protein with von Willebrand factor type A (vWA) domain